ncbi:hypothetical protein D3C75_1385880 [compost metagenome]
MLFLVTHQIDVQGSELLEPGIAAILQRIQEAIVPLLQRGAQGFIRSRRDPAAP